MTLRQAIDLRLKETYFQYCAIMATDGQNAELCIYSSIMGHCRVYTPWRSGLIAFSYVDLQDPLIETILGQILSVAINQEQIHGLPPSQVMKNMDDSIYSDKR